MKPRRRVTPDGRCSSRFSPISANTNRMRRKFKLNQDPVDARQFEVTVKHLANSLNFGQEESVFHGAGLEYAQSRPYVAGDPVKFIDWKVSARVGKLYIKEFQEPKQIPL